MAKVYRCEDCGKVFDIKYQLMVHYDAHKAEPVVRPIACSACAKDVDVRNGYCLNCGHVMMQGWWLPKNINKINELKGKDGKWLQDQM